MQAHSFTQFYIHYSTKIHIHTHRLITQQERCNKNDANLINQRVQNTVLVDKVQIVKSLFL